MPSLVSSRAPRMNGNHSYDWLILSRRACWPLCCLYSKSPVLLDVQRVAKDWSKMRLHLHGNIRWQPWSVFSRSSNPFVRRLSERQLWFFYRMRTKKTCCLTGLKMLRHGARGIYMFLHPPKCIRLNWHRGQITTAVSAFLSCIPRMIRSTRIFAGPL